MESWTKAPSLRPFRSSVTSRRRVPPAASVSESGMAASPSSCAKGRSSTAIRRSPELTLPLPSTSSQSLRRDTSVSSRAGPDALRRSSWSVMPSRRLAWRSNARAGTSGVVGHTGGGAGRATPDTVSTLGFVPGTPTVWTDPDSSGPLPPITTPLVNPSAVRSVPWSWTVKVHPMAADPLRS